MRIRFCLLIMLFAGRYALAQDVIVKQDGGTILSKVLEIGTQEIAYKKWNSQDGPVYKIAKDQVLSVNYQNGEVDRFAVRRITRVRKSCLLSTFPQQKIMRCE